jgi:hypothetical protein
MDRLAVRGVERRERQPANGRQSSCCLGFRQPT